MTDTYVAPIETPENCRHNSRAWNSQQWDKLAPETGKEKCAFCGEERWVIAIRNAVRSEAEGRLFGGLENPDYDELMFMFREMRELGAFIDTSTIHDPIHGKLYSAIGIIWYRDHVGPTLIVQTSIGPIAAMQMLRRALRTWYGKE